MTDVSWGGEISGANDPDFSAVVGDAADVDQVARLTAGHDAVASAPGPNDDESPEVLVEMLDAAVDGIRCVSVDRLAWISGVGILSVGPNMRFIDSPGFPEEWKPVVSVIIEAYGLLEDADGLEWAYVALTAFIEPGERIGEFWTAHSELVANKDGESRISMGDFAIAFADELESGDAVHEQLAVDYWADSLVLRSAT